MKTAQRSNKDDNAQQHTATLQHKCQNVKHLPLK